jgi:DNA-binding response OmpR family regulator
VKKRKILFVDDSADIRRAMGRILELEGFDVVEAEDAPSAIGMLGIVPDVVILDLNMPGARGEAVLEHVRAHALKTRVVVLTAIDPGSPRVKALAPLAPDALLHKPVDWRDLVAACAGTGAPPPAAPRGG